MLYFLVVDLFWKIDHNRAILSWAQSHSEVTLSYWFNSFFRKKFAAPEDVEYFDIQLQMNYDLLDEYKEVERIIGTWISSINTFISSYFK